MYKEIKFKLISFKKTLKYSYLELISHLKKKHTDTVGTLSAPLNNLV